MMLSEFHDLDGNLILVNFAAVIWLKKNLDADGTTLKFARGETLVIKETPEEIITNIKLLAMQGAIKGH
jgi:uncharacterized protein YlzI (FlbEa/FlbD family)